MFMLHARVLSLGKDFEVEMAGVQMSSLCYQRMGNSLRLKCLSRGKFPTPLI